MLEFGIILAMRKIYVRSFFPVFLAAMQFGAPFSDNTVLQRGMQVPIWGKASDHPAIAAVAIADEPSALDFEHMGKAVETVERMSPCGFVYLNLFPSYASAASLTLEQARSQLGTATYEEHIER